MRADIALAIVAIAACGPQAQNQPASPSSGGQQRASSSRVVTLQSGDAARYNEPVPPPQASALMDAIMLAALDAAARNKTAAPVADARLSQACASLASVADFDGNVAYPLVEFALQSNGIIEPAPLLLVWDSNDKPGAIADAIRPQLAELLAAGYTRIGVGSVPRQPSGWSRIAIALQTKRLRTSPISRSVKAGATFGFDVEMGSGYQHPKVAVTRPSGVSEFIDVQPTSPHGFNTRLDCGTTTGRMQIQIIGDGETLAVFPVWCGVTPPTSLTFDTRLNDSPNDPVEAERQILTLVNRGRQVSGGAALSWNEDLAELARAHSRKMRRTGLVKEVLTTTTIADRVRERLAGVWTSVARARGIGEINHILIGSPGLQVHLMSSTAAHIGIGVAYTNLPTSGRELFVTVMIGEAPTQ